MAFQSFGFFAFFLLSVGLTLLAGRRSAAAGRWTLLLCSLAFYAFSQAASLALLALGVGVTFFSARLLSGPCEHRRAVFAAAVFWHVAVLLWFKYANFILASFSAATVHHALSPLGLSFFTFQQIWYLKECYDGSFQPANLRDLALYSAFFPTVSSGPILRPGAFFPQLDTTAFHPTWEDCAAGLYGIAVGLAKKVLLADQLGLIVNKGWQYLGDLTVAEAWCVILGYTFQLYFDFSGYCDMASGVARFFGFRLPRNFDSPYRSLSITEFWKRWHITLTGFLRECVYFPLGGSRKGRARTYLNLLLIFLISGIWHGAGWTFIAWGLGHGLIMVCERLCGRARLEKLPKLLRWAVTFALVNLLWVFFRAPSFAEGWALLRAACAVPLYLPAGWLGEGLLPTELEAAAFFFPGIRAVWGSLLPVLFLGISLLLCLQKQNCQQVMERFRPGGWRAVLTVLLLALSLLSFTGVSTFIYSNF